MNDRRNLDNMIRLTMLILMALYVVKFNEPCWVAIFSNTWFRSNSSRREHI